MAREKSKRGSKGKKKKKKIARARVDLPPLTGRQQDLKKFWAISLAVCLTARRL
jgi:hypothetical protein